MTGFTYILASKRNGTFYVGVTDNLERRIRLKLIERHNPEWRDLYSTMLRKTGSPVVAFGNPEEI